MALITSDHCVGRGARRQTAAAIVAVEGSVAALAGDLAEGRLNSLAEMAATEEEVKGELGRMKAAVADDLGAVGAVTWTIFQQDGPNHLGLWQKCDPCAPNGPHHLGLSALRPVNRWGGGWIWRWGAGSQRLRERLRMAWPG